MGGRQPGALERRRAPATAAAAPRRGTRTAPRTAPSSRSVEVLELCDPVVQQPAARPQQRRAVAGRRGRSAPPRRARPCRCWRSRRTARRPPRGSRRRGTRPGRPRRPRARARGPARACRSDRVMPTARTPCRVAAWITKLPQPQPTSSTRSPSRRPELLADELELGFLRLLERAAPRRGSTRSCRSSSGRGTARRSRCRRRSGGARRGGRARSCAVRRAGAARPSGPAAGITSPQARTSATARLTCWAALSGGGSNVSTIRSAPSRSSTSIMPATYARPRPSSPGARSTWASACGLVNVSVGEPARSPGTSVPSQKRSANGGAEDWRIAPRAAEPSGRTPRLALRS